MIRKILAIMLIAALSVAGAALSEETKTVTAHDYLGEWVDLDGTTNIDICADAEDNVYTVDIHLDSLEDLSLGYTSWAYVCVYDEATRTMKSLSCMKGAGNYEPDSVEKVTDIHSDYTDAAFSFDDAGLLIWSDASESADDGMVFTHTIGWVDPDYVGPGHHFVGEWNDGRMTIYIMENMEYYEVAILGSGSAFDGVYWTYTCDYDAETDSLVSNGMVATKVAYVYSEDGIEYNEEALYDDGEAVFSLNADGRLIWNDRKENAGEGWIFNRVEDEPETEWAAENGSYGYRGEETVEEQVVYDAQGVKITATGLQIVRYAPVLELSIENTSGRRLGFDLAQSSLNDWMWDARLCTWEKNGGGEADVYSEESELYIDDGETLECGLGFSNEYYYEPCGIIGFGKIGFMLRAFDPDSQESIFLTPMIDVVTSLGADYPGVYVDTGALAYEGNDLRILIPGLNGDEYDTGVWVYIYNYSDRPVCVAAESCAVNGEAAEPWFSAVVFPGKQCLATMGFDDDIKEISRLEVSFRVEEYNAFSAEEPATIDISNVVEVDF